MQNAKAVEITPVDTDRYGRTVAHVRCDGVHVNWRQVEDGLAWCFKKYLKQPEVCLPLEEAARQTKKGLWREPNPQPPWEFRAAKRAIDPRVGESLSLTQESTSSLNGLRPPKAALLAGKRQPLSIRAARTRVRR